MRTKFCLPAVWYPNTYLLHYGSRIVSQLSCWIWISHFGC